MSYISANPYAYPLPDNRPALLIIDMQKDFVMQGGFGTLLGNDVTPLQSIVPTLAHLLKTCRDLSMPIIHTREAHRPDLGDCPPSKLQRGNAKIKIGDVGPLGRVLIDGSSGNEIIPELLPMPGEIEIVKPGKGAFYNTPLSSILKQHGITHLIVTGVTTEVCVQTTMREANDRGFECLLVEDCTESYFPQFKQATLEMITAQGAIVGWTASSSTVITALQKQYG